MSIPLLEASPRTQNKLLLPSFTDCGGCNLKFEHPLYYRTHCSVFHDPSMSLTIRKYHCKVCGEAVLGKDNIMKHAAEKHDGKGAYQCQFCSKFFLRLNYLEMHRTYGCASNPNRSRPVCDFCGRKFCQPQKLKAHIKRMHSGKSASRESQEPRAQSPEPRPSLDCNCDRTHPEPHCVCVMSCNVAAT